MAIVRFSRGPGGRVRRTTVSRGVRRFTRRRLTVPYSTNRASTAVALAQPRLIRAPPLRAVHMRDVITENNVSYVFTRGGTGHLLNGLPRGNSIADRTGNRVRMMSLVGTLGVEWLPFHPSFSGKVTERYQREQNCSIIFAYCAHPVTQAPPLSDIYQGFGSASNPIDTWSLKRITDIPSMRVLKRVDFIMRPTPLSSDAGYPLSSTLRFKQIKVRLPLGLMSTYQNDNSSLLGSITSGALFMYFLGDFAPNSNPMGGDMIPLEGLPRARFDLRLAFTNVE